MLNALLDHYRRHRMEPLSFACLHQPACAAEATAFTGPKASFIGPEYQAGRWPRLLFLSLDSGSADHNPANRTFEAVRQQELACDVDALPRNKHWYLTHELAWVLLRRHIPGLTVAGTTPYFAHVNSAKCCQNHAGRSQADRVLFDNCRPFIAPELVLLQPDIIVTQGGEARKVLETSFATVESGGGSCPSAVVRCGEKRSLWIHTHHPSAFGVFHEQRRKCWSRIAEAVERFLTGRPVSIPASPLPRLVSAPRIRVAPVPTIPAPSAGVRAGSIRDVEDVVAAVRTVRSPETFDAFVADMRQRLPGASHPYVGVLSGMRVQPFQNWQFDQNTRWRLTDAQLLAVMRLEFPQATAKVFTADVHTGLQQLKGIRAHYNRDGHNGPSPAERGMPPSVSYGTF